MSTIYYYQYIALYVILLLSDHHGHGLSVGDVQRIYMERAELPISNCIARGRVCETLIEILQNENMWVVGDTQPSITLYLESELRKCGCEIVSDESRTLDLSWGKPGHALLKHMMQRLKRGAPTLLRWDRDMPEEHLRQRERIFWKQFDQACDGIDSQGFHGACALRQLIARRL
jgi:hypothetical protein